MKRIWAFCDRCKCYHVSWDKNDLDKNFETHLDEHDRKAMISFPIFLKPVKGMDKYVAMVCAYPGEDLKHAMKQYPKGFWEKGVDQ